MKNVLFECIRVISVLHISVIPKLLVKQNTSSYSCVVLNIKRAHLKTQRLSHRCSSFFIIYVHINNKEARTSVWKSLRLQMCSFNIQNNTWIRGSILFHEKFWDNRYMQNWYYTYTFKQHIFHFLEWTKSDKDKFSSTNHSKHHTWWR